MWDVGKDLQIAYDEGYQQGKRDAQQWIPCEERLPEEGRHYICTCKDGIRTMVTYVKWQGKLKRWDLTGTRSYWRVIAWMPLPKPYGRRTE